MFKNLIRPLAIFDIEGTGLDTGKDRIVSIAIIKIFPCGNVQTRMHGFFNPGFPMDPKVIAIHGITDDMVKDCPTFAEKAHLYFEFLKDCDLGGYNHSNYDIPILAEEFYRAGFEWKIQDDRGNPLVNIIDAGNIFKKKEERTLSAALQFFCGKVLENAHSAEDDTLATAEVLAAQLAKYPDLASMSMEQLTEYSRFEKRLDLAGKITIDAEGDPCYNIGGPERRGKKVKGDPSFANWMLGKDFPRQTKLVLARYLDWLEEKDREDYPNNLDEEDRESIASQKARATPDAF